LKILDIFGFELEEGLLKPALNSDNLISLNSVCVLYLL